MTPSEPTDPAALAAVAELPALIRLSNVAKFLDVDQRTVRRYIRTGRLRAMKTAAGGSGRVRVARVELARFLATLTTHAPFDGR